MARRKATRLIATPNGKPMERTEANLKKVEQEMAKLADKKATKAETKTQEK